MPEIVVYELHKTPRQVSVEGDVCTIGRNENSDVLLIHTSVSREHARVRSMGFKTWGLEAMSPNASLQLNGAPVPEVKRVKEGDEVQIGPYLLIFSLRKDALDFYRGKAMARLDGNEAGVRQAEQRMAVDMAKETGQLNAATAYVDASVLARFHERIRAAQKAWIQNVSPGPDGKIHTIHLEEAKACLIGKGKKADLRIRGFSWGKPAEIRWKETCYVITHTMWFPKMTVNNKPCKTSPLADGDIIAIGSNLFRFRSG